MPQCRRRNRFLTVGLLSALVWIVGTSLAAAQESGDHKSVPADAFSAADNAWMLTSSALVLMMTAPGLALFYCGLVRKKNVLSVMMQCIFLMCLMTVIWGVYGYTLVFGGKGPWIGDSSYLLMRGVDASWGEGGSGLALYPGLTIPVMTHMIYQGMFFIITPALICGAFAEHMKFKAMIVFMILWGTSGLLSPWPIGSGATAFWPSARRVRTAMAGRGDRLRRRHSGPHQFGCFRLGLRMLLGKRLGFGKEEIRPARYDLHGHRRRHALGGLVRLQRGQRSRPSPGHLRLCSHAFCGGGRRPHLGGLGVAFPRQAERPGGLLRPGAGLACITQAAGYVTLLPALAIGAIGASVCYMACSGVKSYFGYDDSLDVFGVHGVAGTLGAV